MTSPRAEFVPIMSILRRSICDMHIISVCRCYADGGDPDCRKIQEAALGDLRALAVAYIDEACDEEHNHAEICVPQFLRECGLESKEN